MPLTPAEKQARYRERQRQKEQFEAEAQAVTVTEVASDVTVRSLDARVLVQLARERKIVLTPAEEKLIRDFWRYGSSETRTLLERDAVADRIVASGPFVPEPVEA